MVTFRFQNENLAKQLWGTNKDGKTWENIYLVKNKKNIEIPYDCLNPLIGREEKSVIQGFSLLSPEKSERLAQRFHLFSEEICEDIPEQDYVDYILKFEDDLELTTEGSAPRRREQSFLRNYLFGNKSASICGICGRKLPVDMLVTSHIKRRSVCSKQEKLDYKNIVMPMCKFGCDDLYEKGYIYVQDGKVKINHKKYMTDDLREKLSELEDRDCKYYNSNTKHYFDEHRKRFGI